MSEHTVSHTPCAVNDETRRILLDACASTPEGRRFMEAADLAWSVHPYGDVWGAVVRHKRLDEFVGRLIDRYGSVRQQSTGELVMTLCHLSPEKRAAVAAEMFFPSGIQPTLARLWEDVKRVAKVTV
jgi:hypothetical protein